MKVNALALFLPLVIIPLRGLAECQPVIAAFDPLAVAITAQIRSGCAGGETQNQPLAAPAPGFPSGGIPAGEGNELSCTAWYQACVAQCPTCESQCAEARDTCASP